METKTTSTVQAGLILSLILIAVSVGITIGIQDLEFRQKVGYASFLVLLGGIIFYSINHAKEQGGNVTFGNIFAFGFKTTAIITCIMIVFTVISVKLLFPEEVEKGMELAREKMLEQGTLSEDQIDQNLEMGRKIMLPIIIGFTLVIYLIVGAIGGLIGAAAAPKNPNPTPFESDNLS